jgi:hypothetical protein
MAAGAAAYGPRPGFLLRAERFGGEYKHSWHWALSSHPDYWIYAMVTFGIVPTVWYFRKVDPVLRQMVRFTKAKRSSGAGGSEAG